MHVTRIVPLALIVCAAFAQTPPPRLEFEVASIKPTPPITEKVHIGLRVDGSQVYCTGYSLKDYVRVAYRVKDYQVEVPDWMAAERFDVAGKLPPGTTRDQVNDMLQSLMLDRFKLTFHRVKKEFPVYALVVAKGGAKLKESNMDGVKASDLAKPPDNVAASGSAAGVSVDLGQGSMFSITPGKLEARRLSTARMAEFLSRFVDRPVVDMTNLQGAYDLDLTISPEDYQGMLIRSAITAGVALPPEAQRMAMTEIGDSLATALQSVGLRLEARKAPLDVMVVDHMERAPTDN